MKSANLILALMIMMLFSCKKVITQKEDRLLFSMQQSLKDSMSKEQFEALDFNRILRYSTDQENLCYLHIPRKDKSAAETFLMLLINSSGQILKGRQISISRLSDHAQSYKPFDGKVIIQTLKGHKLLEANIERGYSKRPNSLTSIASTQSLQPDPYQMMPVVVVSATRTTDQMVTYSSWISVDYMMGTSGTASSGAYVGLERDLYEGGGGGYTDSGNEPIGVGEMLLVDFEAQWDLPGIDVTKYLACFNKIPDVGASYSIELLADIPVDSDPNKIFDYNSGSPGHTFLQVKKTNGSQSAVQNIGFYPKLGWKPALTNAPMEGKFVDNGEHEYNVSFKMNLSQQNFNSTLTEILYLANFIQYDIDNYNCTDFALDVFNKTRSEKLNIPLIHIPGNYPSTGTRTPQGIFSLLHQMKQSRHPEAGNITINIQKGWVAKSTGPCN